MPAQGRVKQAAAAAPIARWRNAMRILMNAPPLVRFVSHHTTMVSDVKIRPLAAERKLSRRLSEQLAEQIKSGRLAAGARLPTEEELARAARVSRTVVREAVAALRPEGLGIPPQRVAPFVPAPPQPAPLRL